MGDKIKIITGYQQAVTNLVNDVERDNFTIMNVEDFESKYPLMNYPNNYLEKCSSVVVAVSGNNQTSQDWMLIMPKRVDHSGQAGAKVIDRDPTMIVLDRNTSVPEVSGIVAYHQDYETRTTPLCGYSEFSKEQTVQQLRETITTGCSPLSAAPEDIKQSMYHMAKVFERKLPFLTKANPNSNDELPVLDTE
jgi:hypothetical protein